MRKLLWHSTDPCMFSIRSVRAAGGGPQAMSSEYHARSTRFWRASTLRFANWHIGGPKLPWSPPHGDQEQARASGHSTEPGREHLGRSRVEKIGRAKRRQGQSGEAIFPTTLRDRQE